MGATRETRMSMGLHMGLRKDVGFSAIEYECIASYCENSNEHFFIEERAGNIFIHLVTSFQGRAALQFVS